MEPVTLAQMSQDDENHIYCAFKYSHPIEGFDHALILICEQDAGRDSWRLVERTTNVDGFPVRTLGFENASYPGGVNTLGPEDDIGRRRHLIRANPGDVWTAYRQRFDPGQPDAATDLEFYAVIAIVAAARGLPIAQLGDLVVTPTLRVHTDYEHRILRYRQRYGKSQEWQDWMIEHGFRYEGAFRKSLDVPDRIDIAFTYHDEPLAYDPPWINENQHMSYMRNLAEGLYVGYHFNFIFNGNTSSSYANVIAGIPQEGTLEDGSPFATSHVSGKNMYLWYETVFNHEFGHILGLSHHYGPISEAGMGSLMPPGDTRCTMDKSPPLFCSGCAAALNIPLDLDYSARSDAASAGIRRRYPY